MHSSIKTFAIVFCQLQTNFCTNTEKVLRFRQPSKAELTRLSKKGGVKLLGFPVYHPDLKKKKKDKAIHSFTQQSSWQELTGYKTTALTKYSKAEKAHEH